MSSPDPPGRVLIIDDEKTMRLILSEVLTERGCEVLSVASGAEGLNQIPKFRPNLVIVDLQMPHMSGIEFLERVKELSPAIPCVILTAHGSIESAIQAMKSGAFDYLTKPFDNEHLMFVVSRALRFSAMSAKLSELTGRLGVVEGTAVILGESVIMQNLRAQILKVAPTDATVLITGESGTGKELVARAIHFESKRREGPLVVVNCAAIPTRLAESELFGHEKGAFTDANESRAGKFEQATTGTLFLDEVAELSLEIQAKLLRVLQEKVFTRIGGNAPLKADLRVIAATNKDLSQQIAKGEFREDLFYRLGVIQLRTPSLSEHREDIPAYAMAALAKIGEAIGRSFNGYSEQALTFLRTHDWKGNIRELENAIHQAAVFASGSILDASDLNESSPTVRKDGTSIEQDPGLEAHMSSFVQGEEKRFIIDVLKKTGWNRTAAAGILKIGRRTLFDKMRALGIDSSSD